MRVELSECWRSPLGHTEMLMRLPTPALAIHVGDDMRKPGETIIPNMESGEGLSIGASGIECFE